MVSASFKPECCKVTPLVPPLTQHVHLDRHWMRCSGLHGQRAVPLFLAVTAKEVFESCYLLLLCLLCILRHVHRELARKQILIRVASDSHLFPDDRNRGVIRGANSDKTNVWYITTDTFLIMIILISKWWCKILWWAIFTVKWNYDGIFYNNKINQKRNSIIHFQRERNGISQLWSHPFRKVPACLSFRNQRTAWQG